MDKRKQAWHDIRERRGLTLTPYRGRCMYGILRPDQRRAGQEALRQSVIWTTADDDDLRAQVAAGAWIADIAAWHMRSEGGIGMRMQRLDLLPPDDTDD